MSHESNYLMKKVQKIEAYHIKTSFYNVTQN